MVLGTSKRVVGPGIAKTMGTSVCKSLIGCTGCKWPDSRSDPSWHQKWMLWVMRGCQVCIRWNLSKAWVEKAIKYATASIIRLSGVFILRVGLVGA